MNGPVFIANDSNNPVPVKQELTGTADFIITDLLLENLIFSQFDNVDFQIAASQADVNISSTVANAWNDVTTANVMSLFSDQDVIVKFNSAAKSGRTIRAGQEITIENIALTNIFITTTLLTNFSMTLQGE